MTSGIGDMTAGFWYEMFDNVTCVWKVRTIEDLKPAIYLGGALTVPTGVSPYDTVDNSFDVTGRGFYRLDANLLVDKTVYPWSGSFQYSYGVYRERPVNREYGRNVEPYTKKPGDRKLWSLSFGHTTFLESLKTFTVTAAYSDLTEAAGTVDGRKDPSTAIGKRSWALTGALSTMDRNWVWKLTWSHTPTSNGWGRNFPATDVITVGVSHVIR